MTKSLNHGRIPGLDALRGIAAIGVAIHHYHLFYGVGPNLIFLWPIYNGAHFFVDIFFVLSGFLLPQVYANYSSYKDLILRRIARLFPLHWLTLLLVALGQYAYASEYGKTFIYEIHDSYHFILNILLLQQIGLQNGFSFNAPSWSISVEWVINLVFFGMLLYRKFLYLFSVFIAFICANILTSTQSSIRSFSMAFEYLDTALLRAGFGFFVGVIASGINFRLPKLQKSTWIFDISALCSIIYLIIFFLHKPINTLIYIQIFSVGFMMPLLVISCSNGNIIGRVLSIRPLTWLGDISYSVYLMHFPIQLMIWYFRDNIKIPLNSGEGIICYTLFVLFISHIIYNFYELPSQRLFRKIFIKN